MNKNVSTISRELRRNLINSGQYSPFYANYKAKRRHSHKYFFRFAFDYFSDFTEKNKRKVWQKIFGIKASLKYIKNNFDIKTPCLKSIFNWINSNKWIITKSNRLRRNYKKGEKRSASPIRRLVGYTVNYVFSIWTRPKHIDLREEYSHWEADLIIGKRATGYNNILTLSERKTRVGLSVLVRSKNSMKINSVIKKLVNDKKLIVKSITIDNGIEFEKISLLGKWLNIKIYKAEPYASFQRDSNEHWNRMIRREYKKGYDFNQITQEMLDTVVKK